MGSKSYPEYRDSRVKWIGNFPAHWSENRAKYYFKEVDERSINGNEEMLSVSHITGVTPRSQKNVTMFQSESNVGQKLCKPGDIVINTMWAWMSALGVSNYSGIVSPSYGVYRPTNNNDFDSYYLDHLLRTAEYRSEYISRSTGIRSSRLRLYPDKFLDMSIICPPIEEQKIISKFLVVKNHLIKKFIHNKRSLIVLLNEQKKNVINMAVTRGLNSNAKLRKSEVEWVGDIPEHWELLRIRTCVENSVAGIWGEDPSENNIDEHIVCVRVADFNISSLSISSSNLTIRAIPKSGQISRLLKNGDILIEKSGGGDAEPVGRVVYFDLNVPAVSSNFVSRLRPKISVVLPRYLLYVLTNLQVIRRNIPSIKQTTGIQNLDENHYLSNYLALPSLDEQKKIVDFIDNKMISINNAISRLENEIKLIREYQARLSSDVVMGKIDVQNIAVPEVNVEYINEMANEPNDVGEEFITEDDLDEAD